jgi:hypothetical protein
MRKLEEAVAWVAYKIAIRGKHGGQNAVCEQGEWEAMEMANPGYHILIQANITNECEAEKLARGTSGDPKMRPQPRL